MFGKKKQKPQIDQEQFELIQNAQRRIKQKRRLYNHFALFLIGGALIIFANLVLKVGDSFTPFNRPWFLPVILFWLVLVLYHIFNVFITNKFMGATWEKAQLDKLVAKQQKRIETLKNKLPEVSPVETLKTKQKDTKIKNLTIIVAAGENNEIGKNNDLIWHLSDDLKRFKSLTSGHHIIMGRKTFESFPKPLPNRTHIVVSRQENYQVPLGVIVVNSIDDALDAAKGDIQPFVIGGGEIYKQAMPFAARIELTRVHATFDADTFFPEIDSNEWKETASKIHANDDEHDHAFSFLTYERR